jgi:hypothetical protein
MERFIPGAAFSLFYIDMKNFNEYISDANIISCLVRFRVRKAKERNKRNVIYKISSMPKYNFHTATPTDMEVELEKLLPSRRKWRKLRQSARYIDGHLLNTIDKNKLILRNTIKYYQSQKPDEPFVKILNNFILDIQNSCKDPNYKFKKPTIYPKLKDKRNAKKNVCRPIADYQLKDKIIIGLTNKYFTDLFDEYFNHCSYAFRSREKNDDGGFVSLTHHSACSAIKKYRERFIGKNLYVAECDIQKFYDSVNHSQIKKAFKSLLGKMRREKPEYYNADAERLFYKYLDSYTFNKDVLVLNTQENYFKDNKVNPGEFEWVKEELLFKSFYKSIKNTKIGVPQGGALSGLITNIILDQVDRKVLKSGDKDLLYVRYCDDMLIIHPDKEVCLRAFNVYKEALEKLKLIPHEHDELKEPADFWKSKTKIPYLWSTDSDGGQPWVGFVGYEIHYNGQIRVRKKSLGKELQKQKDVVKKVLDSVKGGYNKVSQKAIEESVINTLIGMSVGRVRLWNYKDHPSKLCWVDGFQLIERNKYSEIQLKRLDRSRNNLIKELQSKMRNMSLKAPESKKDEPSQQIIYYGKPFSYYYNLVEKKN